MKLKSAYGLDGRTALFTPWLTPSGVKFVSPAYVDDANIDIRPCYKNLQDAIDEIEDGDTIIIYPGIYVGNFNWDNVVGTPQINVYMHEGAWIKGTAGATTLFLHNDSCLYGNGVITNDSTANYALELQNYESAVIEAKSIGFGGSGVKIVEGGLGNLEAVIDFRIGWLGDSLIHHSSIMKIGTLEALEIHYDEIVLNVDVISDNVTVSTSGKLMCSFGQHIKTSGNCFNVKNGGLLNIIKGRIDRFVATNNTGTGDNYPFKLESGQMKLSNLQAKNVSGSSGGGLVWCGSPTGSLSLANVILQSKSGVGCLYSAVPTPPGPAPNVRYNGLVSMTVDVAGIWTEAITTNKVVSTAISI